MYADASCADVTVCDTDAGEYTAENPTLTSDTVCIAKQGLTKAWPLDYKEHCKGLAEDDASGWYFVANANDVVKEVWCDNEFLGGGWLMIARGTQSDPACWQDGNAGCNENKLVNDQTPKDGSKVISTFPVGPTARVNENWYASVTYYRIRMTSNHPTRSGNQFWKGKDGGGKHYNHHADATGSANCASLNIDMSNQRCGSQHPNHDGVGDWPSNGCLHSNHRGEKWYWKNAATCSGGNYCSGTGHEKGGCNVALFIR